MEVAKSNSKEEFSTENAELIKNLSNENDISETIEKVLEWFSKNEDVKHSNMDGFETLDLKSSIGSDNDDDFEDIKTPSIRSENDDLVEYKDAELKQERYKAPVVPITLNHQENYDVTLINFQSTASFFVTIVREDDKKWNRLIRRLNKIQTKNRLEPLDQIIKGSLCLVEDDGELCRAIVQSSYAETVICFGLDTGKVYLVNTLKDFVYYMSPKIRNTIEFQAINCKLFDVRLPHDQAITKLVYDTVISKIRQPQIKVVTSKPSRFIDENCVAFNIYEVMLFGQNRTTSINQQIASTIQGMEDYDLDNF